MNRIKLAYLISTLNTGGAERQLVNTLNCLDTTKFEIKLFVLKGNNELENQINKNISIVNINIDSYMNPLNISKVIRTIQKFNPTILHSVMYASNLIARFYKIFNTKVKVINHIHGLGSWIKGKHIFIDRLFLKFVDKIIVVSNESRKIRLIREKYPPEKVIVIYNSIASIDYKVKNRTNQKNKIILGTASRLVSLKQLDIGIKLIHTLKNKGQKFEFLIAGSGPEKKKLQKLVTKLGINNQVKFLGQLSDMPSFYKKINCFVLFSRTEDMPLSIVEAFAAGLPVIAPIIGGIPELLNNNSGLLVDVNEDLDSLSDKIIEFFKNLDFKKSHIKNETYATNFFDNLNHKNKLESLYFSLFPKNKN